MNFFIEKIKGKVLDNLFSTLINSLEDGKYLVSIKRLNEEKTPRQFQEQYFAMATTASNHSGISKQTLHKLFKEYREKQGKIASTKDIIDREVWLSWIEDFKWYIFNNLDIIV